MKTLGFLDFNTKLSSAGLIYAHYGKQLIGELLNVPADSEIVNIIYKKLYETYVEPIDGIDNGISPYDGTPRYQISKGISGRVGHLNPHWNEEGVNPDDRFQQAMELVGGDFTEAVDYLYKVWWPARQIVEKAVNSRYEVDPSGRILFIGQGGVPWKEHFFMIEEERQLEGDKITYVIFGDSVGNSWRVQAIGTHRLPLPAEWRSLRDDTLSQVSGIPECIFVHTSGFIGGNKTKEGAIAMARKALELGQSEANGTDAKRAKTTDA